jgi:hypothetical protein
VSGLTPYQRREVETAVRHVGRAMRALSRANLAHPVGIAGQDAWALYDGERRLGQASDRLIDGLEGAPPTPYPKGEET